MISILLFGLLAQTVQASPTDPIAPAREGKLQCVLPNVEKKTCMALSTYTPTATGYTGETEMMIAPAPLTTMVMTAPITIEGDAACGVTSAEDLAAALVRSNGADLPADQAKTVKDQMSAALASYLGKKSCSRIKTVNGGLVQESEIDGVAQPQFTLPMAWVSPADGYRIGM